MKLTIGMFVSANFSSLMNRILLTLGLTFFNATFSKGTNSCFYAGSIFAFYLENKVLT